ncbi:helix-turn-helix domain-containing protein [Ectopseudomonas mendocina]|uniref:Helix-turn-helix domain-containing protein n=1 Tax=Ectopseudomonas mendocina TaxID=300 RepID=A0ABZ2RJJ6_ECTME
MWRQAREGLVFFLKPNSELKFKTPEISDIFVAAIDQELIRSYADTIEEVNIGQVCQISGVEPTSHQLSEYLRQSFLRFFEGISHNPAALRDASAIQNLHDDLLSTLFSGLCKLGKIKPHNTGQFVHRHIVEKAREYILSRRSNPPTVLEICHELRISRRTLHYAFQKVLNINPVTFLRYIRLHGAHRELLTSTPGELLISEIAAHWGFWHLGMFSAYYKDLFGETPSTTVRRINSN